MRIGRPVLAIAFLAGLALAVSWVRRPSRSREAIEPSSPAPFPAPQPLPLPCEPQIVGGSEPGGTLVVFGLLAAVAAGFLAIAIFVFPPAFVVACLVFGPVSLLGLVVLYVHFRAHSDKKSDSGDVRPVGP